jgi:hypothetical protein
MTILKYFSNPAELKTYPPVICPDPFLRTCPTQPGLSYLNMSKNSLLAIFAGSNSVSSILTFI